MGATDWSSWSGFDSQLLSMNEDFIKKHGIKRKILSVG